MEDKAWNNLPITGPKPLVMLYGASGTFGSFGRNNLSSTGHTFRTVAVPGWNFGNGHMAFFSTAMPDGQIIIGVTPQTDNPLLPTSNDFRIAIYDPTRFAMYTVVIPTSSGATSVTNPANNLVGGSDTGDVQAVTISGEDHVLFSNSGYYFGWDIGVNGLYPSIGYLSKSGGQWTYNAGLSKTGDQLRATNIPAYDTIAPNPTPGLNGSYYSTRSVAEMARLPQSGNVVLCHYFSGNGFDSGVLSVVSPDGNLLTTYQVPSITLAGGGSISAFPREVQADPSSNLNDERFVVIYDPVGTGAYATLQEFSYNQSTQTITPQSMPTRPLQNDNHPETCAFDAAGNLYVATTADSNGLFSRQLAVYLKKTGERNLVDQTPVSAGWETTGWPTNCDADYYLEAGANDGLCRSLVVDDVTQAPILACLNGFLKVARPDNDISSPGANLLLAVDSGFELTTSSLVSANNSSFETDVSGWSPFIASITRATPPIAAPAGTFAMRLAAAFNSSAVANIIQTFQFAVTPDQQYIVQGSVLGDTGSANVNFRIGLQWYNASNTYISESYGANVTTSTAAWQAVDATLTVPMGAAFARVVVFVESTTAGHAYFVDAVNAWLANTSYVGLSAFVGRSIATALDGQISLKVTSAFASGAEAQSPFIVVTAGRDYIAKGFFKAGAGTAPVICELRINWYDSSQVFISQSAATLNATSSTSIWREGRAAASAPNGAAFAKVIASTATISAGQIHYFDRVTIQAQPFTTPEKVGLGLDVLRASYDQVGFRRASIVGRRMYLPVNQMLTAAEQGAYPQAPINKPQWLCGIDLIQLLGE